MTVEFLWHVLGEPYAPRRCKHRVLLESGPYFVAQATCRRIPDPTEDWKSSSFQVKQFPKNTVDAGGQWSSVRPPLPPKAARPPRPKPWSATSIPPGLLEELLRFRNAGEDAVVLGLSWPYTEEEVRSAFRRKAREAHPDTGGTAEAFVRLRASHDRLLESLKGRRASA